MPTPTKSKTPAAPLPDAMRDLLFGDLPLKMWVRGEGEPWSHFAEAQRCIDAGDRAGASAALKKVLTAEGLESRHYLQAWSALRQLSFKSTAAEARKLFGVVVEVGMPKGLDLLAAYADHTARYFNFSGSAVILDTADAEITPLIDELLAVGQQIVEKTGPWNKPRPAAPGAGQCRINFLTAGGVHFGQGAMEVLMKDPGAGPALKRATLLMQKMVAKAQAGRKK